MKRSIVAVLAVISFMMFMRLPAQAQDVHATARVDSNNILIGDQLTVHVELEYPTQMKAPSPVPGDSLQGLEIVRRDSPMVKRTDQRVLESVNFTITGFDSGMYVVPPLVFSYFIAGDTIAKTVQTSPIPVFVHGISGVDTTKEIKAIKPPRTVPITFADLLPYIIGVVIVAGLVWLFVYIRKKRKRGESILPSAPARPAHEVALESLRALEAEHLWQRSKVKEFHSQLTEILRTYIERRFGLMAMEMTSDEILSSSVIETLDRTVKEALKEILLRADFVKFAKHLPTQQENESSLPAAEGFVQSTYRPPAPPPQPLQQTTPHEVSA